VNFLFFCRGSSPAMLLACAFAASLCTRRMAVSGDSGCGSTQSVEG
jgi:hypothetical protein